MFAYHLMALRAGTVGSAQDLHQYALAGRALGHEVLIYGPPDPTSPFSFSLDVESVDGLIFVFEWTTHLRKGDELDFARFVTKVPRERRVVIDCDGAYNDPLSVDTDYNHRDHAASRAWTQACDSLSGKICQPTLRPRRGKVRPFLFYGFNPSAVESYTKGAKDYGMVYVGHSKFRWAAMERVLRAIEPVREQVGRLAVIGHGWDALPAWAGPMHMEEAFYTDQAYLRKLEVEIRPPIPFEQVIAWMSRARVNPVLNMDGEHVRDVYGEVAAELMLPAEHPERKILDMVRRSERYVKIVDGVRAHLAAYHSHARRFKELIKIVES